MSAIMAEPAPTWEVRALKSKAEGPLPLVWLGLAIITLTGTALILLLPGLPATIIRYLDTWLWQVHILARWLSWVPNLLYHLLYVGMGHIILIAVALSRAALTLISVGRSVITGPVLAFLALCGATVIAGQVWLVRLLSSRRPEQQM